MATLVSAMKLKYIANFQKVEEEGTLPKSFYKVSMFLIYPNQTKTSKFKTINQSAL